MHRTVALVTQTQEPYQMRPAAPRYDDLLVAVDAHALGRVDGARRPVGGGKSLLPAAVVQRIVV